MKHEGEEKRGREWKGKTVTEEQGDKG